MPQVAVNRSAADAESLAHLSPARFEHINRLAKYTFADQETLLRSGLCALRQPAQAVALTA